MAIKDIWYSGFIIFKEEYGEKDLRLLLLTQEKGIIHLFCKNALSSKSKLGSLLQYYTLVRCKIGGRFGNYISQVELEAVTIQYKKSKTFSAYYINELIKYLVAVESLSEQDSYRLFHAYRKVLINIYTCDEGNELLLHLRQFEMDLLSCLGVIYRLDQDYSSKPLDYHKNYFINSDHGLVDPQEFLQDLAQYDFINNHNREQSNQLTTQDNFRNSQYKLSLDVAINQAHLVDSIDPLKQAYQEYLLSQQQEIVQWTFKGKYLLLMHKLFLEEQLLESGDQYQELDLKKIANLDYPQHSDISAWEFLQSLNPYESKELLNQARRLINYYLEPLIGNRTLYSRQAMLDYLKVMEYLEHDS